MRALLDANPRTKALVSKASEHRLQVVLGSVETTAGGKQTLVQRGFRAGEEYFYPASTVKLFAAVAALERLAELRAETGLAIDADTPLIYHPLFDGETLVDADPSNLDGGTITVRHEIRKLFLVSDNEAFNRLYELVGQDGLARSLARAGLPEVRIVHRLSEARTPEENRRAPRIDFAGIGFKYTLPERTALALPDPPAMPGLAVGTAHLTDAGRVEAPLDFSAKNRVSLTDLQRGLCMVVRPDVDCGGAGFVLGEADRVLLTEAMSQFPVQSMNPRYDAAEYPDDYVKYLLPGLETVVPREKLKIYNKVGEAYGFLIENAYVVNEATGHNVFLAATLYANADGVLNDDQYDYETVGQPFFRDLGAALGRKLWPQGVR